MVSWFLCFDVRSCIVSCKPQDSASQPRFKVQTERHEHARRAHVRCRRWSRYGLATVYKTVSWSSFRREIRSFKKMSAQRLVMWVLCALVCLSICSHFTARAAWDCPPCSKMSPCSRDDDVVKARDACVGGVVYEPCGCCKVCAKVEGESCAGPYVSEGRCDGDLRCTVSEELSLKGKLNETGICLRKSKYSYTKLGFCYQVCKYMHEWVQAR